MHKFGQQKTVHQSTWNVREFEQRINRFDEKSVSEKVSKDSNNNELYVNYSNNFERRQCEFHIKSIR
jgi:hypothetical protein